MSHHRQLLLYYCNNISFLCYVTSTCRVHGSMNRESRGVHQSFGVRRCVAVLAAAACVAQRNQTTTATELGTSIPSPAILVALQEGPAGELALREWSAYAGESLLDNGSATVWVLCTTNETKLRSGNHLTCTRSSWTKYLPGYMFLKSSSCCQTTVINTQASRGCLAKAVCRTRSSRNQ